MLRAPDRPAEDVTSVNTAERGGPAARTDFAPKPTGNIAPVRPNIFMNSRRDCNRPEPLLTLASGRWGPVWFGHAPAHFFQLVIFLI